MHNLGTVAFDRMVVSASAPGKALSAPLGWLVVLLIGAPLASLAQSDLRNTFPGRRLGGGTRGECSARLVANLVPPNSVFAPGAGRTLGILEGPTAQPRPLQVVFKPAGQAGGGTAQRDLPATGAAITLLSIAPVQQSTIWETGYRCDGGQASGSELGLDFVETSSPPAQSLLVADVQPADQRVEASLLQLKGSCGKTVATATVAKAFGIEDAITAEWPQQLPVRCL
jgi:hypothetical protein